ncbi:tetraspanin-19 isoform X2 [Hemicordylus capensis]|uniref:tetraspanin-19 isoform X2 n=1 Tax=Hemicordylus capensis TaxID=884348 RepID=UPI002302A38C|nr:tetraspanin-19 isoform X2 [Hemicordylus capensis]
MRASLFRMCRYNLNSGLGFFQKKEHISSWCHLNKKENEKTRQTLHCKILPKYPQWNFLVSTDGQSLVSCVSIMVLASGFIIVFIGLLGYLGSLHGIKWLVVMYMGLLVLVLAMQAAVLVLLYRGKEMIPNLWKVQMDELISTYGNKNLNSEEHQWDILDNFQRMVHCCGRYNFTDWKKNEHKEHEGLLPCSCTTFTTKKRFCDALENATYTRGCEEDIKMWYENNAWLLISINSGLLSVDVLQFIAAVWLFRIMKSSIVLPKN